MEFQGIPGQFTASGEHKPPKILMLSVGVSLLVLACICALAAIGTHLAAPGMIAIAIAIPGASILYAVRRSPRESSSKWSYAVRPQGLLRRVDHREALVTWDDMAEVFYYPSQFEGEPLSVYRIVTVGHEEIRITSSTGNHDAIGRAVMNEANRRYAETAEALLNGGGKVEFGDMWISRTHFGFERKSLLWEALSSVSFEAVATGSGSQLTRMMFMATPSNSRQQFCVVQAYSIPYLKAFVQVLNRMPVRVDGLNPVAT